MRNRRNRRRRTPFQWMWLLILWILLAAALAVGVYFLGHQRNPDGTEKPSVFSVMSVSADDSTHYAAADVIAASGVVKGQSVLSLNKRKIAERVIEKLAYVKAVSVTTGDTFRDIHLTVTEQEIFGAVYHDAVWYLVGEDGRVLESRPVQSDRPERYMMIRGTTLANDRPQIGDMAMTAQERDTIRQVLEAFAQNRLPGVSAIDLTVRSDFTVEWNRRLTVRLGNVSNVEHQIAVLAVALPRINDKYGWDADGVIDLRSYADATADNNYAVFTPQELIPKTTYPLSTLSTRPADSGAKSASDGKDG